jgi:hypothetical protein
MTVRSQKITLKRVHVNIVAVERNKYKVFWVCMCVFLLSCSACKAHAPYYIVICSLSESTIIFPHYLIMGAILAHKCKKLLNIKCVFWFSVRICLKYFSMSEECMICYDKYDIWYNTIRYDMIWYMIYGMIWFDTIWYMIRYLWTAIRLTPGGSSTVHIYK